jgi:hypothetical protein
VLLPIARTNPVTGHGVDTKSDINLLWIVVFLIENIVFRKGPLRSNHEK